jgi:hypothetical protein
MKASASTTTNRISTFVLLIVLIVMALSLVALGLAVDSFVRGYQLQAMYMLAIGFIAMGLSSYLLLQSRRRITTVKMETPATMTTIECRKCGFKSVREFQRGDYVFKELEMCQKCDDRQIITSIYKEVKEKEKAFPF